MKEPLTVRKYEIRLLLKMFTSQLGCLLDRAGMVQIEHLLDSKEDITAKWLDESLRKKAEGEGEFRILQSDRLTELVIYHGFQDFSHFRKSIEQVDNRYRAWDKTGIFLRVVTHAEFNIHADESFQHWLPPLVGPVAWTDGMLSDVAGNFEDIFRGASAGILVLDEASLKRIPPNKVLELFAWAAATQGAVQICDLSDTRYLNKIQQAATVRHEPLQLGQLMLWVLALEHFKPEDTSTNAPSAAKEGKDGITNIIHGKIENQFVQTGGTISGEGLSIFGNVILGRKEGKDGSQG